ncbi:hypothetical protein B0H17DRAFT_1223052 [Mycena rosella]|uniref:Uncharacterized protein n=1 Tax=Mycena rosella TaxID=1033263 RepID=A0AAD7AWI5_MYCRO|nr:hypothetical protein B0H17DRAFT_1223052 [Mycena rosella]
MAAVCLPNALMLPNSVQNIGSRASRLNLGHLGDPYVTGTSCLDIYLRLVSIRNDLEQETRLCEVLRFILTLALSD